jgi:hypothetical protein
VNKKKVVIQVENKKRPKRSDQAMQEKYHTNQHLPSQAYLITEVGKKEVMRPF